GVKPGVSHGSTDDFGYNVAQDGVHVHDLQATILHLLGIDHTRLTFKFQGRHYRLTDVHGEVVRPLLACRLLVAVGARRGRASRAPAPQGSSAAQWPQRSAIDYGGG